MLSQGAALSGLYDSFQLWAVLLSLSLLGLIAFDDPAEFHYPDREFYPVVVDGTEMEVLAIRTAGGEVRTAFNTCQSCYTSGHGYYAVDGAGLVCQNCGSRFTAEEVGSEGCGGCNPWPIPASERVETGDSILIPYAVLVDAKEAFSNRDE